MIWKPCRQQLHSLFSEHGPLMKRQYVNHEFYAERDISLLSILPVHFRFKGC